MHSVRQIQVCLTVSVFIISDLLPYSYNQIVKYCRYARFPENTRCRIEPATGFIHTEDEMQLSIIST